MEKNVISALAGGGQGWLGTAGDAAHGETLKLGPEAMHELGFVIAVSKSAHLMEYEYYFSPMALSH